MRSEPESGFGSFCCLTTTFTITTVKPARPHHPLPLVLLSLLASFSLISLLFLLPQSSPVRFSSSRFLPYLPGSLHSRAGGSTWKQSKMFTFNFTFHVPNPFSMSTLTSVANAATDAFNSVATDIREDPELLNYMVAGGFGYDSNRLVKFPPASCPTTPLSPPTSPKSRRSKGRHTVGFGLTNPRAQDRRRCSPAHERNHADFQGSTSGFVYVDSPPGSGTPKFPTQTIHQPSSFLHSGTHGPGQAQGVSVSNRLNHDPFFPESRKRGWIPALSEPSHASTNEDFTTGFLDTPRHPDVNEMGGVAFKRGLGLDGREPSGMGSGVGDRRKWEEGNQGEGEDDSGESWVSAFHSRPFAFVGCSGRRLCGHDPDSVYGRKMCTCPGTEQKLIMSLPVGMMHPESSSLPLSLHDWDPSSPSSTPYFSPPPPPIHMDE